MRDAPADSRGALVRAEHRAQRAGAPFRHAARRPASANSGGAIAAASAALISMLDSAGPQSPSKAPNSADTASTDTAFTHEARNTNTTFDTTLSTHRPPTGQIHQHVDDDHAESVQADRAARDRVLQIAEGERAQRAADGVAVQAEEDAHHDQQSGDGWKPNGKAWKQRRLHQQAEPRHQPDHGGGAHQAGGSTTCAVASTTSTSSSRSSATLGRTTAACSRPRWRRETSTTSPIDDALGKDAVEPGGEHAVADDDVGVAVQVVHVARPIHAALHDAARAAALHDRVDAAVVVGEQDHARRRVAGLRDLPDDALRARAPPCRGARCRARRGRWSASSPAGPGRARSPGRRTPTPSRRARKPSSSARRAFSRSSSPSRTSSPSAPATCSCRRWLSRRASTTIDVAGPHAARRRGRIQLNTDLKRRQRVEQQLPDRIAVGLRADADGEEQQGDRGAGRRR